MAESRGVEPHPISENPVFKAGRRTNAPALLSIKQQDSLFALFQVKLFYLLNES